MSPLAPGSFVHFPGVAPPTSRLVCFHHAGGSAQAFRSWRAWLPPSVELLAVQMAGREGRLRTPFSTSVDAVVREIGEALEALQPLPWTAFGHSLGGSLAYETVLAAQGRRPARGLVVAAARAPHLPGLSLGHLSDEDLVRELGAMAGTPRAVLEDRAALSFFLPRIRADFGMAGAYLRQTAMPVGCPVWCLFGSADTVVLPAQAAAWRAYTTNRFVLREFDGDHFFVQKQGRDLIASILDAVRDDVSAPLD